MEAIILAGGLGTRLQSIVKDIPKPMAPIQDKPFLEYILRYLKKNDIQRVILSVGYKWEIIKDYFGGNFNGIELVYSIEDSPLGTGGAIKKAIKEVKNESTLIINGDTFFNIKLNLLKLTSNSKIMLSLKKMYDFSRYGCVEVDTAGNVLNFTEKSYHKVGNINGGIYLISKKIFENYELDENFAFEAFMEDNLIQLHITSKVFDNYFVDIGIPQDYKRAQTEIVTFHKNMK